MKILLVLISVWPAVAACIPVGADRILGSDLAVADPRFSVVPASYTVAFSPPPGGQRVFAAAELARLARAHGLALSAPAELCFEVPLRHAGDEELSRAMRRSLPAGVEIGIVERSLADVPSGDIVFPLGGLAPAPAGGRDVQLWRGYVRYTETRRVPIWARVSLMQKLTAVVAERNLLPNVPVDALSLRVETRNGPLVREQVAVNTEEVVGRVPKRPIGAGSVIPLSLLELPPTVRRGDPVKVEVLCGPARLRFDAVAEREGRAGEVVELRNPSSGKTFRARLEHSKAVVVVPSWQPAGEQLP